MTPRTFNDILAAARRLATARVRRHVVGEGKNLSGETKENVQKRVEKAEKDIGDLIIGLYSFEELEKLKDEYVATLDNTRHGNMDPTDHEVSEIVLDGFLTWLKEKSQK